MSDHAGFLQAIIAEPHEDVHRLVFADWLEEHGEDDHASFIRVQCELAKLGPKRRVHRGYPRSLGGGYVEIPATTNDDFKAGERVDLIDGVAQKGKVARALLVTRIIPDEDTSLGSLTVVLKRDETSARCDPKREKALRHRERDLLFDNWPRWTHEAFDGLAHDVGVACGDNNALHVHLYDERKNELAEFGCSFRRGFVASLTCTCPLWVGERCQRCDRTGWVVERVGEGTGAERDTCPDCHGSGVTGRCGPRLVRAAPLTEVRLSDWHLNEADNGTWYFSGVHSSDWPLMFETLWAQVFPTRQAALDVASPALLLWARYAAELADVRAERERINREVLCHQPGASLGDFCNDSLCPKCGGRDKDLARRERELVALAG